jgi:RHS repeat-associated protein
LSNTTIKQGDNVKLTTTRNYDNYYRMTSISSASGSVTKSYNYTYDDKDRRSKLDLADGTSWVYTYDEQGQVVSGVKHDADGKAIPGQSFGYDYDGIGNLTSEQRNVAAMNIAYTANNVNQYTQRTFPGIAPVIGEADPTAAVKAIRTDIRDPGYADTMIVPARDGKYFSGVFSNIANTAASRNVTYDVYATKTAGNQQLVKKQSESFLVPKRDQSFSSDADGDMLSTGVWNYTWNGENQLTVSINVANTVKQEYAYDFAGRRTYKKTYSWTSGAWSLTQHLKFAYYGFKLLAEYDGATDILLRRYFWSDDKLEWMYNGSSVYYYVVDGNKNITALVDSSGNIAAEYSYDPFGKIIAQSGAMADINPFRFSSEYFDAETGLVYYNFRYYSPDLRRWLSRDPIGENGGVNLYAMVNNNPVSYIDLLGMLTHKESIDYLKSNASVFTVAIKVSFSL